MANADDFDRFVGRAIKNSVWVPNQRGGAKSGSLLSQRSAFRPLAQARDNRLDASFKWTNECREIGLEIVENVIEVLELRMSSRSLSAACVKITLIMIDDTSQEQPQPAHR